MDSYRIHSTFSDFTIANQYIMMSRIELRKTKFARNLKHLAFLRTFGIDIGIGERGAKAA
jgi:hypothetical protein